MPTFFNFFLKKNKQKGLWRRSNFYRCSWTLHFARQTLYAVFFACRIRFAFREWVSRGISPIIQRDGANVDAYAISDAAIPVYCAGCSVYSKFFGGFNWSPDFVTVMFTYNLSFSLKIRVYWQKIHLNYFRKPQILGFLLIKDTKHFGLASVT